VSTDIVQAVKEAGVVGAGGAGFPTHIKLASKVDTYIANGAECEPLLRVDEHLMITKPEKIVHGLQLGMQSTGAERGIIAVKRKYREAIKVLRKAIKDDKRIKLFLLEDVYPAGDEFVLVYETTKRLIPERGLPLDVGVVVSNVGTLINISNAFHGKPVTKRFVTISGEVKDPKTVEFPIGTTVREALKAVGGVKNSRTKIIMGGPLMGKVITNLETPITKTSSAIIVLPEDHYLISMKTQRISSKVIVTKAACIRCQLCTEVCPRYLLGHDLHPDKIMRAVAWGGIGSPNNLTGAFLCVDCGVCTFYGCPMGLDPAKINLEVRDQLITEGLKNPHHNKDLHVHKERENRKIPTKRLVARLNLTEYEHPAPLMKEAFKVDKVVIPLKQHIGSPALPTVKEGDNVSEGDLIGKIPNGSLGATVHASINGTVVKINDKIVIERK